ncbi:thioesterase II family protein [Streptomyces rhizosphaericus]|uniref:Thioesterase n=1 Tax=Streptomyces rhizosphaericus TaxID=114699 RepID=A0A6G4AWJ4_9ACTN|nr:alpha/beta fold hydrolase [Streptomyces rhizosphaericus]NEW77620.1 thioesterase [Streptomyces rhizosphaericus]
MSLTLLCVPFSGSGAGFFRAWQKLDTPGVSVVALQLPGREERFAEAPYLDLNAAVHDLAEQSFRAVSPSVTVAVFGHSRFGAVLAFELARVLEEQGLLTVAHVLVSGSPGPLIKPPRISDLDDDTFVARVEQMSGYRHTAFDIPQLRELLIPVLRADTAIHEDYEPFSNAPLASPITALRGSDDSLVSRAEAELWRSATSSTFELIEFSGEHMYLTDSAREVLSAIAEIEKKTK